MVNCSLENPSHSPLGKDSISQACEMPTCRKPRGLKPVTHNCSERRVATKSLLCQSSYQLFFHILLLTSPTTYAAVTNIVILQIKELGLREAG